MVVSKVTIPHQKDLKSIDNDTLLILKRTAQYVRRIMVDMIFQANKDMPRRGHYGSSTSSVELYVAQLARLVNPYRDLIAWKPHASPVVYALLYLLGEIQIEDLKKLRQRNSPCQAYLNHWLTPTVEVSTGCMGFPLPFCCGQAMADKIENRARRTYVNLGDGEFTMPMCLESIRFAAMHRLNNFGVIVDDNHQSMSGLTVDILGERPVEDYFRFFGWKVIIVGNGHDLHALWDAFGDFEREMLVNERPVALVAKTNKWYGLPEPDKVASHAHLRTLDKESYRTFLKQHGAKDNASAFPTPPEDVAAYFQQLRSGLKGAISSQTSVASPAVTNVALGKSSSQPLSTLDAVRETFRDFVKEADGRNGIIYVDPDLGAFPGMLPEQTGPNSVEGEAYSLKNPAGFVVRAGLADPFAVALAAGMGKDANRYPVIPILAGFGLLVSEQIKQASLSGSRFLTLGIETNPWEGLTHQPGTSAGTALRNLPDRPVEQWGSPWEFGVHVFVPCHPREANLLFKKCFEERLLAYLKLSSHVIPQQLLSVFDAVSNEDFLKGGYIIGPEYHTPDLVILAAGPEVYTAIRAVDLLKEKSPDIKIQISIVSYLNLVTSDNTEHQALMNRLAPSAVPLLRLAGLPLDALGVSREPRELTCGTRYLTQSCSPEELSSDQGYDLATVITAAEDLLAR